MLHRRECDWLLAAFALLVVGVAADHGRYSVRALAPVIGGAAAFSAAGLASRFAEGDHGAQSDRWGLTRLLALLLAALLLVGTADVPGVYVSPGWYTPVYRVHQLILVAVILVQLVRTSGRAAVHTRANDRGWVGVAALGIGSALLLRMGMIVESPSPAIDVFTQFQESAAHLLAGLNPYTTPVSDSFRSMARYGYQVPAYAYPAANLYPQALAFAALGDIRYATIVSDGITAAAIIAIVPRSQRPTGLLVALLFLHQPRSLFVLEQAWNEPLMIAAAALFCWASAVVVRSKRGAAAQGALLGVFLGLKQYLVFFALAAALVRRDGRVLATAAGVFMMLWAPFVVWDADAAIRNGLLFQFTTPFRPDGLNISSLLHQFFGWTPSKSVAVAAGFLGTIAMGWKFRRDETVSAWLYVGIAGTFAAFLFGSQAFANYYHFLASLILVLVAVRLRESSVA